MGRRRSTMPKNLENEKLMRRSHIWKKKKRIFNAYVLLFLHTVSVRQKEQLPSGHTLSCRTWRTANRRVRSGQAATPAAKHLWGYRESETCVCGAATCDLGHMTNCRHFGERPNRDEIAGMADGAVRWMSAVADTI